MNHTQTILTICSLGLSALLSGDEVTLKDKSVREGTVSSMTETQLTVDGEVVQQALVSRVTFDAFEIPRSRFGVILNNGTWLSGSILDRGRKQLSFYSVIAGGVEIPMSDVTGVYYEPQDEWKPVKRVVPGVVTKAGEVVPARRIMWADQESAAVLTEEGLRKFPANTLSRVWWKSPPAAPFVVLRNGDALTEGVSFHGDHIRFTLFEQDVRLELKALESIDLKMKPE